jgi:hypothetical protein
MATFEQCIARPCANKVDGTSTRHVVVLGVDVCTRVSKDAPIG